MAWKTEGLSACWNTNTAVMVRKLKKQKVSKILPLYMTKTFRFLKLTEPEREREGERLPPAEPGLLLACSCSWWRTSLIKFSSTRLTLSEPIRQQHRGYTAACPLSSLSYPLCFHPFHARIFPSAGRSITLKLFVYSTYGFSLPNANPWRFLMLVGLWKFAQLHLLSQNKIDLH